MFQCAYCAYSSLQVTFITKQKKRGLKEHGLVWENFQKHFLFQYYNQPHFTKEPLCKVQKKKKKWQKLMSKPGVCNFKFQVILIPGLLDYLPQPTYWSLLSLQLMGSSPSMTACLFPFVYIIAVRLNDCPKSLFNLHIEQHRKADHFPSE